LTTKLTRHTAASLSSPQHVIPSEQSFRLRNNCESRDLAFQCQRNHHTPRNFRPSPPAHHTHTLARHVYQQD